MSEKSSRAMFLLMLAALLCMPAQGLAADVSYEWIRLRLEPDRSFMSAQAKLRIDASKGGEKEVFLLGRDFRVKKAVLDGVVVRPVIISQQELEKRLDRPEGYYEGALGLELSLRPGRNVLEITNEGTVYDTLIVPEYSRASVPEQTRGLIGDEGVYLGPRSYWYPSRPLDLSLFSIRIETPEGIEPVTEGKLVEHSIKDGRLTTSWEINYPSSEITLVAGRYLVHEEEMDGVKIMAYFFPSEKDLIEDYVKAVRIYIDMYNRLIGPYPFSKFAVVENFFPTGYGMPSYTLLGRRVIRLPFIVRTSLGHEVAHNWWGNSVYPDYESGNWCEGLTVYYADHRYKEAISDSAAIDYRRTLLMDYVAYVRPENDFPLSAFEERTTPGSRAIGYGKCAFVFHMLRRMVGEETFYRTMRSFYERYRFRLASWDDIESVFEKSVGRKLDRYFDQWVRRAGAPKLSLANAEVYSTESHSVLKFRLAQDSLYDLVVPIVVYGRDTSLSFDVELDRAESLYVIECGFEPLKLDVDPSYDVFRKLDPMEMPPTISSVLGEENLAIVLPSRSEEKQREAYVDLAKQLARGGGAVVREDTAITVRDLARRSLLLLGSREENALLEITPIGDGAALSLGELRILGRSYSGKGASCFFVFRSPFNPVKNICVVCGLSPEAIESSGYKIIHYGKYSYVTFTDGHKVASGVLPAPGNPMSVSFTGSGR